MTSTKDLVPVPTAAPILIGSARSPFVRKIRILLFEKSIAAEWHTDYYDYVSEVNPLSKVPVLLTPGGERLFDSRVIAEYLEILNPHVQMLPSDSLARLEVKRWEALADGICDAAVAIVVETTLRPTTDQRQDWIDKQTGKIERGLRAASERLDGRRWCHGDRLSLADVALISAVGYLSFRLPARSWHQGLSRMAPWYEQMSDRLSVTRTVPTIGASPAGSGPSLL